jgi:hypothetical protein
MEKTSSLLHCSVEFPIKMSSSSSERRFTAEEESLIENLFYERQTFFLSLDKDLRQVVNDESLIILVGAGFSPPRFPNLLPSLDIDSFTKLV